MAGTVRMWKISKDSYAEDYIALQNIINKWDKVSDLDIVWSEDLELVTYSGDGKRVNPEVPKPCCCQREVYNKQLWKLDGLANKDINTEKDFSDIICNKNFPQPTSL